MFIYKDYNFVNYILDLPYYDGLDFYNHCIGRFNDIDENKLWDLFLLDIQNGNFEGSFENYKKEKLLIAENKTMSNEDAEKEYLRISANVNKIVELDKKRRIQKSG